ncbi:TIGR01244 family sulfur transferase [uncultured Rhodoferax sp.]|uniref:TIGR01244 family sulfur transferase n=1 Tax=uncultured Rhodoferax sp. TaxID=223188 RepID=UPI0025D3A4C3|nr:TIGR01244 family sulfur transferase [uncultured Rhodoferax sp.]
MTLRTQALTPHFAVAAQMDASMVADAVAQGFKTLVNNRPDGEGGPDQPLSSSVEAAARAAGLHYVHIPVVSGAITPEQVQAMREALQAAPQPVLAFCRSGARSAQLFALTQAE